MIDHATIERIQSAAQIYDVVSDFISLRKRGVNYVGLCPFHEDSSPSFYVSPSKNICKCFACQEGGTPIHFIMKHESLSYPDALRYLAKKYSIEIKETEMTDEQRQIKDDKESMFILNDFALKRFVHNMFETEEGQMIGLSYFKERGFRTDIIKKFGLGYSIDAWDNLVKEAEKSGYKRLFLEKTGLAVVRDNGSLIDRFRGRVMFPVHTLSGKVVAFGGRTLKKDEKAKYVNSPESDIYHKSNELYGLYFARQAIVKQDKCFLVEGYTDVISMHQAGLENVVASSGTALTQGQIRLITRFTKNVTVLYDGDAAGIKAALRGIDLLLEYGLNIKIVLLPEGEDPDSFARKQNAESLVDYITKNETDFIRFKVNLLIKDAENDPVKKVKMIEDIVGTVALIPEEIVRLVYIKECSKLLDIQEAVLARNIAHKRQEIFVQKKKALHPQPEEESKQQDYTTSVVLPPVEKKKEEPFISEFDRYEQALLHYVIRYGEQSFEVTDEEDPTRVYLSNVIDYIYGDLQIDGLRLKNPLFDRILNEAYELKEQPGFVAETYFINHPDPEISQLAVNLATNRYIESKVHYKSREPEKDAERLKDQLPYECLNYKWQVLVNSMKESNQRLKAAEAQNNYDEVMVVLKELALYQEAKKELSKLLRERIIV